MCSVESVPCCTFKGELLELDKIALVKLSGSDLSVKFIEMTKNKSFVVYNEISMPIELTKDFYEDYFIKPAVVKEVVSILGVYKQLMDREGVLDAICYASSVLNEAKNNNGFLNEIAGITGLKFRVLTPEEELNYVYTSVINTFNKPKGLIVHLSDYSTSFMLYNRRNILNTLVIDYGYINAYNDAEEHDEKYAIDKLNKRIASELKSNDWITNLQEEFEVVCTGDMFRGFGAISRKASKYPVDMEHNFEFNKENFEKVYSAIKAQDIGKTTKVKGVRLELCKYLPYAFATMNAILPNINKDVFAISKTDESEGLLFNYVLPLTIEKPISDALGYSLQVINEYYDRKPNNALHVYELSMILFKQLKVLHKLGRSYIKVLRIASYLYASGLRVNNSTKEKAAFDIILNSEIYGVSHKELVLAAFVVFVRNADNFSLSDWVKYKELVTEEDLAAVKKLAVILKIAESLDVTGFGSVTDINCDILGDSVIMKTIVTLDSSLEIKNAMLNANEFRKAFKKNLEIL